MSRIDYENTRQPAVVFGSGSISKLADKIKNMGVKKALIVTDKGVVGLGIVNKVAAQLDKAGIRHEVMDEVMPEPTDELCIRIAKRINEGNFDMVLGVGGGSPLDASKASSLIAGIPEEIKDLHEYSATGTKMKGSYRRNCVLITIPTTAGTGAETTYSSVLTSSQHKLKFSFVSPNIAADLCIIDPDFQIGMPKGPTINGGLDALCHAVENVVGTSSSEYSDLIIIECIRKIWQWLPIAVKEPENRTARENIAWAAHNAQASGGIPNGHAIGHAIGSLYHLVHASSCVIVLPTVIRHFAETNQEGIAKVAGAIGTPLCGDAIADANHVADSIKNFYKGFGIRSLKEYMQEIDGTVDDFDTFHDKMVPFVKDDFKSKAWNPPIYDDAEQMRKVLSMVYNED